MKEKRIKKKTILIQIAFCRILFISFVVLNSMVWIKRNFPSATSREIFFQIFSPMKGVGKAILFNYIVHCIVLPLLYTCIFVVIGFNVFKVTIKLELFTRFKKKDVQLYPLKAINAISLIISLFCLSSAAVFAQKNFGIIDFLAYSFKTSTFYEDNYIHPDSITYKFPEKKRNLIILFIESMETSFTSTREGGILQENCIPNLYELAKKEINFSGSDDIGGGLQINGASWTVGAIIAHFMAFPLIIPPGKFPYDVDKGFFPNAKGLLEILAEHGYHNYFLSGTDTEFGGRKDFFTRHGNTTILDYNYYKSKGALPPDYYVWWGFEDRKLYAFAKQELLEISSHDEPFCFIIFTADTHHDGGYLDEETPQLHSDKYYDVLLSADRRAMDFLTWVKTQEFYSNTTVIVLGDHLYMASNFFPDQNLLKERRIYNCYLNTVKKPIKSKNRLFSAVDTMPTILDAIGVEYNAPGIGLGRSLFKDTPTLIETLGFAAFDQEIQKNPGYIRILLLETIEYIKKYITIEI